MACALPSPSPSPSSSTVVRACPGASPGPSPGHGPRAFSSAPAVLRISSPTQRNRSAGAAAAGVRSSKHEPPPSAPVLAAHHGHREPGVPPGDRVQARHRGAPLLTLGKLQCWGGRRHVLHHPPHQHSSHYITWQNTPGHLVAQLFMIFCSPGINVWET